MTGGKEVNDKCVFAFGTQMEQYITNEIYVGGSFVVLYICVGCKHTFTLGMLAVNIDSPFCNSDTLRFLHSASLLCFIKQQKRCSLPILSLGFSNSDNW